MGTLFVDKLDPQSGTSLEIGSSGDTITIPAGATITNNGTQTGFGGTNTPAFEAKLGSVQDIGSSGVFTKINYDTETFDIGSNYDTTNKRFLPTTAGKYFVYFSLHLYGDIGNTISDVRATIYKNGSEYTLARTEWVSTSIDFSGATLNGFATMDLNGSSDYVEIYGFSQDVDVGSTDISQTKSLFGAYKIIE